MLLLVCSSKYFEGLLFILVRRPYAIGDCIHISDPNSDTAFTGSAWWLIEDVNLFTTSVIYLFTNERATLSNGSMANSRIINSTRSVNACLYNLLKFPINAPYEKLQGECPGITLKRFASIRTLSLGSPNATLQSSIKL